MEALIKNDTRGRMDLLCPIPEWADATAFSVFDCYGYSLCEEYTECDEPRFEFGTREIANPYRQSEKDPETVIQRTARQIL